VRRFRRRSVVAPAAVLVADEDKTAAPAGGVEPEPVEPAKASEPEPRPPTVLELLGRKPHPLLAWGIRAEQPAWPAKREPEPRVSYGGNLLRASEVADAQRVVDAAAEWQRLRDERPWTREIAGPFGVRDRDWWV
jgi:hypothetical protein